MALPHDVLECDKGPKESQAMDLEGLYAQMARIRRFEEAEVGLWQRGLITGELHSAIGEEAVHAGVCAQLRDGDAVAVDHRSTPPFVARGVDLRLLLLELVGDDLGLNRGNAGHMHLMARSHLTAASGIVGASAPLAAGFALAGETLRPGSVAVAFFGEGAANQGMVMEAFNLAVAWNLPVVFVCKDNRWAIFTRSARVTGGDLVRRAAAFGMPAQRVDGTRVDKVWKAAQGAVGRARRGGGPSFLLFRVPRPLGHFLGDPLLRMIGRPAPESGEMMRGLASAALSPGGGAPLSRLAGLGAVLRTSAVAAVDKMRAGIDPLRIAARRLPPALVEAADREASKEVDGAMTSLFASLGPAAHA